MTDPTPLEEAKRSLVASLRDPDQVVLDASHAQEWADGTQAPAGSGAPRCCIVILEIRALERAGLTEAGVGTLTAAALGTTPIEALREYGGPGCADRIEAHS